MVEVVERVVCVRVAHHAEEAAQLGARNSQRRIQAKLDKHELQQHHQLCLVVQKHVELHRVQVCGTESPLLVHSEDE